MKMFTKLIFKKVMADNKFDTKIRMHVHFLFTKSYA